MLVLHLLNPGPYPFQPLLVVSNSLLNFAFLISKKIVQMIETDICLKKLLNLLQGEAQIFERDNPVNVRKLLNRVIAVAGCRIYVLRPEKSYAVVIPQGAYGNLCKFGKVTDPEHEISLPEKWTP